MWLSYVLAVAGLNMAVFLLIGKTSALTMNIAGVVKDWLLIGLSVVLFHSAVTSLNLGGYFLAFLAVCWYNYQKLQAAKAAVSAAPSPKASAEERIPLRVLSASALESKEQQA